MDNNILLERIKALIKSLNLSPSQFAKLININQSNFSKMLRGDRDIAANVIIAIADNTSVNMNWLLRGTGTMFKSEEQVTPAIDKDVEYLKSIISAQSKTIETQERTISMLERQLQIVGENNSNQPMQTIV